MYSADSKPVEEPKDPARSPNQTNELYIKNRGCTSHQWVIKADLDEANQRGKKEKEWRRIFVLDVE
eukprot:scaffold11429_cov88-Skeletonema_dohrnii-CCMP3373.AAC.2